MGNCVRREVGFEVEDNTDAPPAPEIIDKIVLLKKKTKRKQKVPVEENLNNIEIKIFFHNALLIYFSIYYLQLSYSTMKNFFNYKFYVFFRVIITMIK